VNKAIISSCGNYRYRLWRGNGPTLHFVMLNPSTADATVDDPTIRRCLSFAAREGCSGLQVTNLFAFRSPSPRVMFEAPDPVGPENDRHLSEMSARASVCGEKIVCAWGRHAPRARVEKVLSILHTANPALWCLGKNLNGSPKHPLYVCGTAPLREYP
jgi:hypothetical protein